MRNRLYFICPTDYLESTISEAFQQEHYFYSSLGNSVVFDQETVEQINAIVESENIKEITFLLSRDNSILQAALKNHKYTNIQGMSEFYHRVNNCFGNLDFNQNVEDIELQLIISHLDDKSNELCQVLNNWLVDNITVNALIYYPKKDAFIQADSELFGLDSAHLN